MDSPYDVAAWQAAVAAGPQAFIHGYRMRGAALKGWELVNLAEMADSPDAVEHVGVWARKGSDTRALLRIAISEFADAGSALLGLHRVLSNSMHPKLAPAPSKLAGAAGVCFAEGSPQGKGVQAAFLTVGNLAVSVTSVGDKAVDVSAVVGRLGTIFGGAPSAAALGGKGSRELTRATPARGAGALSVPLIERLSEHTQGGRWVKVLAPEGELRRAGDALLYIGTRAGRSRARSFVLELA